MQINVLFFGYAKELTSTRHFVLKIDEMVTLEQCKRLLEIEFPELKKMASFAFAINKEYVKDTNIELSDGDELAVLPPVSGG